jgi:hypothetical protein
MSRAARIPSLLRELADAFDELLAAERPRKRRRSAQAPTGPAPSAAAVRQVRGALRKQGVAA